MDIDQESELEKTSGQREGTMALRQEPPVCLPLDSHYITSVVGGRQAVKQE